MIIPYANTLLSIFLYSLSIPAINIIAVKYKNDTKRTFIYFDFLDWLQFRHWYKHTYRSQIKFKQEQIQNKEEAKILETILQNAQNDIDRLRAQSEKEFNQGTKIIKR